MKNSFWLACQFIITILFSIVTLKLNLIAFGEITFGCWVSIASVWTAATAFDGGFATSSTILIAEARKCGDFQKIKTICTSMFITYVLIAIVFFTIVFSIITILYTGPSLKAGIHKIVFFKISFGLGLSFIFLYIQNCFKGLFEGFEDFPTIAKIGLFNNLLLFSLVAATAFFKLSIVFLSYAYAIASSTTFIIMFSIARLKFKALIFKSEYISFSIIKTLSYQGWHVQLSTIFSGLIDPIIKYIIGSQLAMQHVTAYEVARRFIIAISGLFYASFRNIIPKVSSHPTLSQFHSFLRNEIGTISKMSNAYIGLFIGINTLIVWLLIHYWFKIDSAMLTFSIIILPEIISILAFPFYMTLIGKKFSQIPMLIQLINLILMSSGTFLGYHFFKTDLALLSLFFSVAISDIIIVYFFKTNFAFNIFEIITRSTILKSLCLICLFFNSIFLSYHGKHTTGAVIVVTGSVLLYTANIVHLLSFFKQRLFKKNDITKTAS